MKKRINNKRILLLSILLVFIIMGAASAASDDNATMLSDDSGSDEVISSVNEANKVEAVPTSTVNEIISAADNDNLGADDIKNFTTLNNEIRKGNDIKLNGYYKYDPDTDAAYNGGILITKDVVIDGQGTTTIDGNHLTRIFYIDERVSNFTLKGVTILNANSNSENGGVIYVPGAIDNFNLNGTFKNNRALDGGVIYFNSKFTTNVTVDGTFINNTARYGGVLRFVDGSNGNINLNGNYENNTAQDAACFSFEGTYTGTININGKYKNNTVSNRGVIFFFTKY